MKIASLFDRIDNLAIVRSTFGKIAPIELAYRGMDSSDTKPILDDIYKTSELICTGMYTKDTSFEYKELATGIRRIHDLIISENYTHYSAIVNASKAAYLSVLMDTGIDEVKHYDSGVDLRSIKLPEPIHPAINKIKTFRPEAFFYWNEIYNLLKTE